MSTHMPGFDIHQQHGFHSGDAFDAHSEHVNVRHPSSSDHSNSLFQFFPLLPLELRQRICPFALLLPPISPVICSEDDALVPRKRSTTLMAINTEFQAATSQVETSYRNGRPTDSTSFLNLNLNLDIDTLFLVNAKPFSLRHDLAPPANSHLGPRKALKIAIPWETWHELLQSAESYWWNPSGGEILMETMKKIHDLGVAEILLVVSCNKGARSVEKTEIDFGYPTREFPEDESRWNKFLGLLSLESPHFEWEKVALAVQFFIQAVQDLDLQYMMELGKSWIPYHCVLPTVGAERFSYSEGWTSPKFRFVEAKSVNGGVGVEV